MTLDATSLSAASIDTLEASIRGDVVRPGDGDYDEARSVWNGSIDRRPAMVVRCEHAADVRAAVDFVRDHDLLVAVRGGGHSFPGLSTCDRGVVIDLGRMNQIDVDVETSRARVAAGALLGDLDAATQPHGLAVPAGIVSHTGVAGLTLGGGLGWQQRKHGLTIDNLLSVEMVTASGEIVRASSEENPDLFWGVRGGGGNFGIVTTFEFRTNTVGPNVVAGPVFWPAEETRDVLGFYRDWAAESPDEITTIVFQRKLRAGPAIPSDLVGRSVVGVVACHVGSIEDGEEALAPLKGFGTPILDLCEPKPFLDHQAMFDQSFPHGGWYYVRSCDVAELADGVIDVMIEHGGRIESDMSSIALWQMGGAVARVGDDETAFHGRTAGFTFNINGNTETAEGFEAEREWARSCWTALEPYHTSVYVNFLMDEGEERIRQAYGEQKYQRLKDLKRRYDPSNLFRLNQNIPPG